MTDLLKVPLSAPPTEKQPPPRAATVPQSRLRSTGRCPHGRRRMYVVGLAVFTLASAAAALAGIADQLIGARVLQGAGAAVLLPLTLILISDAFPAEKRGVAIGLWAG
jgi:MFS family permease